VNGYTGEFPIRVRVKSGQAYYGTGSGAELSHVELLRLTSTVPEGGSTEADPADPVPEYIYPNSQFDMDTGLFIDPLREDSYAEAFVRVRFDRRGFGRDLQGRFYVVRVVAPNTGNPVYADSVNLAAQGDSDSYFSIGPGTVKHFRLVAPWYVYGDTNIISYAMHTLDLQSGASTQDGQAGAAELLIYVRPYCFPGWVNANLTGAAALTMVEPGIANSAMGRAAASTDYADEIALAKDEIAARLRSAGIELDRIPTDAVADCTVTGAPQAIANYLIPELCDAATYLALAIIHERYATRGDDWDSYKSQTYRERFENAFQMAIKSLPMNIDGDWDLDVAEDKVGSPKTLSL